MNKVILVLIDGCGDVSYSNIDDQTPLQKSNSPNIDSLCKRGISGVYDPFEPGFSCGSDTAHLSIFGYSPLKYYSGRGCFECMGAGCHLEIGDIGFKCNFATMDFKSGVVKSRRCDRNFIKEGPVLCQYLTNTKVPGFDVEVTIKYATEHRCGIRFRGKNISNKITDTDPLKNNLKLRKCAPTVDKDHPEYSNAVYTAEFVNKLNDQLSEKLLKHEINSERQKIGKNVANVILFRGAGIRLQVQDFQKKHQMKGFMVAPTCIISGFGLNIGLDLKVVEGATGDVHSDYNKKGAGFMKVMMNEDYGFGFLHIKGVDDSSHDGEVDMKVSLIEKVDKMVGNILQQVKNEKDRYIMVVTGDHSTPCSFKDHSYEPVPFLIAEVNKKVKVTDGVEKFGEIECARGFLGRFPGQEVFKVIKNFVAIK